MSSQWGGLTRERETTRWQFRAKPAVLAAFAKRVRRSETRTGLAGRKDSRARKTRSIGAKEKAYEKRGKRNRRNRATLLARCGFRRREKDRDSAISRLIPPDCPCPRERIEGPVIKKWILIH